MSESDQAADGLDRWDNEGGATGGDALEAAGGQNNKLMPLERQVRLGRKLK